MIPNTCAATIHRPSKTDDGYHIAKELRVRALKWDHEVEGKRSWRRCGMWCGTQTLVASSVLDVTYVTTIDDVLPTQALSIKTK